MACSDCSKLSDVKSQLADTKAALKNVRAQLTDTQKLNCVLERFALTVDNKLVALQGAYQKLKKRVGTSMRSRSVKSDCAAKGSIEEEDSDDQFFDAISDQQDGSDNVEDTEGEQEMSDGPTASLITNSREVSTRGKKKRSTSRSPIKRRRKSVLASAEHSVKSKSYDSNSYSNEGPKALTSSNKKVHEKELGRSPVKLRKQIGKKTSSPNVSEKYNCDHCDFTARYFIDLRNHANIHPGYKNIYKCKSNDCLESFNSSTSLLYHLFKEHPKLTNHKGFPCPVKRCKKVLFNKQNLSTHVKKHSIHFGEMI